MKIHRMFKFIYITTIIFLTAACSENFEDIAEPYSFRNSSFESGTLVGWEASGEAFKASNVSFELQDNHGNYFNQVGDFFYHGGKNNLGNKTGTLISEKFVLKGNGIIGYLIGAGQNSLKTYVSVINEKGDEIIKSGNQYFDDTDTLYRQTFDLKDYIGQTLRIKIVDNDDTENDFNYINIDDFVINYQGGIHVNNKINEANKYIENNLHRVNQQYRHTYHAMSPIGWSNDPNGIIWYNDEFHLFFQFNPYDVKWGPMHWGHYTTKDFIKWTMQPVALAPDRSYDSELGAFSGTAIEKDGDLYLMYTSVANNQQTQSIAISKDGGITFNKIAQNPVIPSELNPPGVHPNEIRDPAVFKHDGIYYVLIGTRVNGKGQLVLYKSSNMLTFEYVGNLMNSSNPNEPNYLPLDGVYECPSFAIIDGKQVLLISPQFLPQDGIKHQNIHSNVYAIGNLDFETGKWSYDELLDIDSGFDFYAPQMTQLPDGRTIMIAWMQMWDRTIPTASHNWTGAYTLPRELTVVDGRLIQKPVREVENYRISPVVQNDVLVKSGENISIDGIFGKTVELNLEFDVTKASQMGVELFKGTTNKTKIYYDADSETVVFDRSQSGIKITGQEINNDTRSVHVKPINNKIKLRIFIDVSSVEVFINDGLHTMTGNVYPDMNDTGISFFSIGGDTLFSQIEKYTIYVG